MKPPPYPVPPEPPLLSVAELVCEVVRGHPVLDEAMEGYLRHPQSDNVRARFLSQRRAYEVTVLLDAAAFVRSAPPMMPVEP